MLDESQLEMEMEWNELRWLKGNVKLEKKRKSYNVVVNSRN